MRVRVSNENTALCAAPTRSIAQCVSQALQKFLNHAFASDAGIDQGFGFDQIVDLCGAGVNG